MKSNVSRLEIPHLEDFEYPEDAQFEVRPCGTLLIWNHDKTELYSGFSEWVSFNTAAGNKLKT